MEYRDFSENIHRLAMEKKRVINAQMELTYACNLHCVHCYTDCFNTPQDLKKELSTEKIKSIIDEMVDLGVLWLNFTGGEIFMHRDFFEIYEYAHSKGFILTLYTNGTVFTEKILNRLKNHPPFYIDVSCHSVDEKAFDAFTQVSGSFKRFLKGMAMLKASGLEFRMKTKAMNWNQNEMSAIRSYVESFGIDFSFTHSLTPRLNGDLSSLQYRLDEEAISRLEEIEGIYMNDRESCKEMAEWVSEPSNDKLYQCRCATDSIHISTRGELGACGMAYEVRRSLRQMSLPQAIDEVFTQIHSMRYQEESACSSCQVFTFCDSSKVCNTTWNCGFVKSP